MKSAGSNMDCLLKVVVWPRNQKEQAAFDKVYRSYFSSDEVLPTPTRIQAGATPFDCGLEIGVIGYVPEKQGLRLRAGAKPGATRDFFTLARPGPSRGRCYTFRLRIQP